MLGDSVDEVQRYITFARQFKPTLNKDAQDFIVEQYKHLRERDSTSMARSAWRITVRQLESMIRLSEAMARLYCQDEVTRMVISLCVEIVQCAVISTTNNRFV